LIQKESRALEIDLTRLTNFTLHLAVKNMAFRGSSDKLYIHNKGKYLGLVQLLAKFDPVMQEHISHILKGELADDYCGKNILNGLTDLMAEKVNPKINFIHSKCKIFFYNSRLYSRY
jgi:ribosomal protein L33